MDPTSSAFYSQDGLLVEVYDNQTMAEWEASQHDVPWTFRYEMRHLVESRGFVVEAEYSDFHRSPPQYGKEQILVLSRGQTD
jgi:hypothetical protein